MEWSMKELYLMRHGKTQENIEHILMGQIDSPLCDEARVEILSIKPYVVKPDQIISSDLKRASETARMLFPGMELTQLPQLRERHFGVLQGYSYQALEKKGLKVLKTLNFILQKLSEAQLREILTLVNGLR